MEGKKTDRRTKYTKMVIKQALLELMKNRPLGKITVTDICELAEINRGTFYNYYTDPYDLLRQIEIELFDEINASLEKQLTAGTNYMLLLEIFEYVAANSNLCKILFSEYGDKDFIRRIVYIAHDRSVAEWKALVKGADINELELLYTFIANGCVGIIQNWLQNDMKQSPKEIADFISRFSDIGLQTILEGKKTTKAIKSF